MPSTPTCPLYPAKQLQCNISAAFWHETFLRKVTLPFFNGQRCPPIWTWLSIICGTESIEKSEIKCNSLEHPKIWNKLYWTPRIDCTRWTSEGGVSQWEDTAPQWSTPLEVTLLIIKHTIIKQSHYKPNLIKVLIKHQSWFIFLHGVLLC